VNEGLEEPRTEEAIPEFVPAPAAAEIEKRLPSGLAWLRLAYSIEFLLALIAILTLWSEVGGQGHLDLMPWYTKLACLVASAVCCVRFTAGLVEEQKAWNRRTKAWFAGILAMAAIIGGITYYYHLHEETDQPDSDDATSAVMLRRAFPSHDRFSR